MPTVSVVLPAYQVTPYIAEALDSVFAQTFKDFETIVVNDCCPDTVNLERVLVPYLSRIRYIKLARNGRASAARNAGIEAAQGTYVAFFDPDDILEPRYLEINVGMLLTDKMLDVVYGDLRIFGQTQEAGRIGMDLRPSVGEVNFSSLMSLRCNVFTGAIARREMLQRVGMFDPRQQRCEDFDLWLRIARAGGKFRYHRQIVLHYRKRDLSLSSDSRIALQAMIEYCEKVKREFNLTPQELELAEKQRREFCAELDVVEAKQALDAGRTLEAIEYFRRAQAFYQSRKLAWVLLSMRVAPGLVRWIQRFRNRPPSRTAPQTP